MANITAEEKSTPSVSCGGPGLVQGWMRVPLSSARAPCFGRITARDDASASTKASLIFPMNYTSESWRTARELDPLRDRGSIFQWRRGAFEVRMKGCDALVLCILSVIAGRVHGLQFRQRSCLWFWRIGCLCKTAFSKIGIVLAFLEGWDDSESTLTHHQRWFTWHKDAARGGTVVACKCCPTIQLRATWTSCTNVYCHLSCVHGAICDYVNIGKKIHKQLINYLKMTIIPFICVTWISWLSIYEIRQSIS